MGAQKPQVYSIAAHRGFADALVAGLVPRYSDGDLGLARLTLLLPSARAARTISEAFIRHSGAQAAADTPQGLLMPRMAVVGDLDLDEALGPLFDPLAAAAADIPPAADPQYRWLRLAELIRAERGDAAPKGSAMLRLAFEMGRVMDRLLAEEIAPEELVQERVLNLLGDLAEHHVGSLRLFARVQARWLAELGARGEVDAATRRNLLFRHAAAQWQTQPPATPVVAAGVTSAAPALARLLKTVSQLPDGAVVLPDLDLSEKTEMWDELGSAGAPEAEPPLAAGDAVTHPQYHLKLLLNRMSVARAEVQHWHRAGASKGPPERTHAISSLFLPPQASRVWASLEPSQRRLSGVRLIESANPEEEAQAIALLARRALEDPEKRVAIITPDRGLAGRVVQHLRRWHVEADDTAGRPLPQTPAGRLFLLLGEVAAQDAAPVALMALLVHPLVKAGDERAGWLEQARALELALRGPRPAPGLAALRPISDKACLSEWWAGAEQVLAPLMDQGSDLLADRLDRMAAAGEALCGTALWAREDGRALAAFVEELRRHARTVGTRIDRSDTATALRDAMERTAVRPPWGGHPRIAIYGLLESRMTRADLVICAGLNEGTWPGVPQADPLLAPAILRALGVPGADFRIGLAAHDLAGALGAPEVVLSRAARDAAGPVIPSRFLLRVRALLGEKAASHTDNGIMVLARAVDNAPRIPAHPRPRPMPNAQQRRKDISVTALDRLRSDPYQFYASAILRLSDLEPLDADPSDRWRGIAAHEILEKWHQDSRPMHEVAAEVLQQMNAHPLMRALWRPRLLRALDWVEQEIAAHQPDRRPIKFEEWGEMNVRGIRIFGKVDRIDQLPEGGLSIVDYKTGGPPSRKQVQQGYALQLGTIGLMVEAGGFQGLEGNPQGFEYWSLGKSKRGDNEFGYCESAAKISPKQAGIELADFLPETRRMLDEALEKWILGDEPFTARENPDAKVYTSFDHLMRLDEWIAGGDEEP